MRLAFGTVDIDSPPWPLFAWLCECSKIIYLLEGNANTVVKVGSMQVNTVVAIDLYTRVTKNICGIQNYPTRSQPFVISFVQWMIGSKSSKNSETNWLVEAKFVNSRFGGLLPHCASHCIILFHSTFLTGMKVYQNF